MLKSFKQLTKFEKCLWVISVAVVTGTFFLFKSDGYLTLSASLVGVTALIFVAKGHAIGQVLTIVFAVMYGIISLEMRYYGEMITYLGMTAPMALVALIQWLRHPYKETSEVKVKKLSSKGVVLMLFLALLTTVIFYFLLKKLGNASLFVSTLSITTSFLASYLTAVRSPYYALAYSANDVVLVVLWIVASIKDISFVPMVACFVMFLLNDLYGFINWKRMEKRQA